MFVNIHNFGDINLLILEFVTTYAIFQQNEVGVKSLSVKFILPIHLRKRINNVLRSIYVGCLLGSRYYHQPIS